ncbi:MAG: MarR family transcriptional regulator [Oscillospiraceae bacterium]|nr:MarR family transcriptional regulator [Oscillospiraceae bacterium]
MERDYQSVQHLLRHIWSKQHKILSHRLDETGVYRSQHRLLMYLSDHQEELLSQKKLAAAMEISDAAVAVSLKKLERGGYIFRQQDETDCRLNRVFLTELGNRVVKRSREIFSQHDREMFSDLDHSELEQLITLLTKLKMNLKATIEREEIE